MRIYLFIVLLLFCSPALQAATLEQQRDLFQQARTALNHHQMKRFQVLKDRLLDYPLTPYLDIWHASKKLNKGDDSLVAATLLAYGDVPESINLRRSWLKYLAAKGYWVDVRQLLEQSPKLALRFPEYAMLTDWNTGREKAAVAQFSQRWVAAKSFSLQSNPLYHAWQNLGHPSDIERWQRIGVLARKRQWIKVLALAHVLNKEQKHWLVFWRKLQASPEKIVQVWPKNLLQTQAVMPATLILTDVIKRLSRRDVQQAWNALQGLKASPVFQSKPLLLAKLERTIALRAARQHKGIALAWLLHLPESVQNEDTRSWQVRLAIVMKKWPLVLQAIASMPDVESQQDRWRYWQARAWGALGEGQRAKHQFAQVAMGRGYYSFLSAERVDQAFQLRTTAMQASDALLAEVEAMPGIVRAAEWLALDKRSKASREWHIALAGVDTSHWQAAAILAGRWHWDDQVIRAAFKAKALDDLEARFPMSYKKIVLHEAQRSGLEPAMIWSIIRQESAFNQHAVSYVGAKGLMQLMPATARHVANKLHMGNHRPRLFSAAVNIRLGASYLAGVNARFGNLALAAAGYNAGPHRVATWLRRVSFESPEAWVEAIPFDETRRYVQQVMAFVTLYEWRQNKQLSSLQARLYAGVHAETDAEVHANGNTNGHAKVQKVSFNQAVVIHKAAELK